MRVKGSNVRFTDIQPELVVGILVMEDIYHEVVNNRRMVITSCNDGVHGGSSGFDATQTPPSNSFHYLGRAVDIRANDIPVEKATLIVEMGGELLGEFDVVLEYPGTARAHVHLEYDPH